jgi:hypothetical protein
MKYLSLLKKTTSFLYTTVFLCFKKDVVYYQGIDGIAAQEIQIRMK